MLRERLVHSLGPDVVADRPGVVARWGVDGNEPVGARVVRTGHDGPTGGSIRWAGARRIAYDNRERQGHTQDSQRLGSFHGDFFVESSESSAADCVHNQDNDVHMFKGLVLSVRNWFVVSARLKLIALLMTRSSP